MNFLIKVMNMLFPQVMNMLYTWREVNETYGYPLKVREALDNGELYKVARGYYSEKPYINPFILIAAKYPYAIITLDTAFYIHGLTDVIPEKTYLATLRNATRITNKEVVQVFHSESIFAQGKTEMEYDGVSVIIYDKERMLVEALRNSKSLPFDYYKEIIGGYRKIVDSLDFRKIEEYISIFRKNEYLSNMLRREVL
jgi:predicted transcriptional regulator of viral defense system